MALSKRLADALPQSRFAHGPMGDVPACKTVIFSNRPHLLTHEFALQHDVPCINLDARASRGIEKELTAYFATKWIYGSPGHPAVIRHIDGYNQLRDWRRQSPLNRLREFASRHIFTMRDHFGLGRYGRIG